LFYLGYASGELTHLVVEHVLLLLGLDILFHDPIGHNLLFLNALNLILYCFLPFPPSNVVVIPIVFAILVIFPARRVARVSLGEHKHNIAQSKLQVFGRVGHYILNLLSFFGSTVARLSFLFFSIPHVCEGDPISPVEAQRDHVLSRGEIVKQL